MEENNQKSTTVARTAHIISDVFCPLLTPTYAMIVAMCLTRLSFLPGGIRLWTTLGIFGITCMLPLVFILILLRTGRVSDMSISNPRHRRAPYWASIISCRSPCPDMAVDILCWSRPGIYSVHDYHQLVENQCPHGRHSRFCCNSILAVANRPSDICAARMEQYRISAYRRNGMVAPVSQSPHTLADCCRCRACVLGRICSAFYYDIIIYPR